jgi:hemoglobin
MGRVIVVVVLSVLMSTGAAWAEGFKAKSLYERLGGKDAITAVVDTFVTKVGADKRINGYFASTDLTKLKMHQGQVRREAGLPPVRVGVPSRLYSRSSKPVDTFLSHA